MRRACLAAMLVAACGGHRDGAPFIEGVGVPVEIAVDDGGIYVSDELGRLVGYRLDGGGRTALATAPQIHQLALDATDVYYGAIDRVHQEIEVRRADKASGGSSAIATDWPVMDVAVDATHVYWASTQLKRASKRGGAPQVLAETMARGQIALDDAYVYLGSYGDLERVHKAGGPPEILWKTTGEPIAIAVHGAELWWIEEAGMHRTLQHATIGGRPARIALAGEPIAIAWAADQLYVIDSIDGAIARVNASGAVTQLGRTPSPVDLAVHGDYVYVIDDKPPGAVYRFAR